MRAPGKLSRKRRAAANCSSRARCVRSPETTMTSGRLATIDAWSAGTMLGSRRPKCRSEICASVRTPETLRLPGRRAGLCCRHNDAKGARADTVVQRRLQEDHLAIGGDRQPPRPRADRDLLRVEHLQFGRARGADGMLHRQHQQLAAARRRCPAYPELTQIQRAALANVEACWPLFRFCRQKQKLMCPPTTP